MWARLFASIEMDPITVEGVKTLFPNVPVDKSAQVSRFLAPLETAH
jgi:hypothetical protein